MKSLLFCLSLLFYGSLSIGQADGFYFQSTSTSPFENYTAEEVARRAPSTETSDENQFVFALKDGLLLHITATESQIYMLTSIVYENDVYVIEALSGLSGNKYYYYIDNSGYKPVFAMLADIKNDKMSGLRYNNISTKAFKPFRQY